MEKELAGHALDTNNTINTEKSLRNNNREKRGEQTVADLDDDSDWNSVDEEEKDAQRVYEEDKTKAEG